MKKRKKIKQISIPEPCHENWNDMSPVDQGRFCKSCEKVVHDASEFSDAKLSNFIASNENVCVQVLSSQVDRPLNVSESGFSPLLSRAAVAVGLISLTATGSAFSQSKRTMGAAAYVEKQVCNDTTRQVNDQVKQGKVKAKLEVVLKGKVLDPNGKYVNEATIYFEDGTKVNTNKLGEFKSKVEYYAGENIKIRVTKSPYVERVLFVDPSSKEKLIIKLKQYHLKGKVISK